MNLRVTLITGVVRQGRYVKHTKHELHLYDGLPRRVKLHMIADVIKMPSYPPGTCAADLDDA